MHLNEEWVSPASVLLDYFSHIRVGEVVAPVRRSIEVTCFPKAFSATLLISLIFLYCRYKTIVDRANKK